MIEESLYQLDELLGISPLVRDVEIVQRSVWGTDFEKFLTYRYRILRSWWLDRWEQLTHLQVAAIEASCQFIPMATIAALIGES